MKIAPLFLIGCLSLLTACSGHDVVCFSHFYEFTPDGIPTDFEYLFSPLCPDTAVTAARPVDKVLVVRYNINCRSKSIILNFEETSLVGDSISSFSKEVRLFDDTGHPLGRGNYGIFELSDTLSRDITLPPGYTLTVSSPLPKKSTSGVEAIGLVISHR